jgi:hypothetical protein
MIGLIIIPFLFNDILFWKMEKAMKKIWLMVGIFLILASLARAEVKIVRESQSEIDLGEILEIKIAILNNDTLDKEAVIFEQVSRNAELIQPDKANYVVSRNEVQYFRWHGDLIANNVTVFTYKIKPIEPGVYESAPTKVVVGENTYFSSALSVLVNCLPDGKCEGNENYLNCVADCRSGSEDGYCDRIADGICDGDCDFDSDVDCVGERTEVGFWDKVRNFFVELFG